MYCRQCHYDLRALTTNRCPECGSEFNPEIPDTYYREYPSIGWHLRTTLKRLRQYCIRQRVQIVFVFSAFCALVILILPSPRLNWQGEPVRLSVQNLKMILTEWKIQQHKSHEITAFDKRLATENLPPSISPWSEKTRAKARSAVFDFAQKSILCAPTIVVMLLISLLWRGRARRIALTLSVIILLSICTAIDPEFVSKSLLASNRKYLDDYLILNGIDIENPPFGGTTIVAYDSQSFTGEQRRTIGFADGHVVSWWDHRAKVLFEEQGIPYPQPEESDSEKR